MAFNRDRNSGGGRRFDNRRQDRGRPQMYPATCSNCGKACEVPFKPTGSKPVLCNDCFRVQGGPDRRDSRRAFDKPHFGPPPPPPHKEFENINHKLDKILEILMTATEVEIPVEAKEEIIQVMEEAPKEKKTKAKKETSEELTS